MHVSVAAPHEEQPYGVSAEDGGASPSPAVQRVVRAADGSVMLHVACGDKGWVAVGIEGPTSRKLFLGGYKHKQTGREYHHAVCQTDQAPPPPRPQRFARDTQTVQQATRSVLTAREATTQARLRPGCLRCPQGDKHHPFRPGACRATPVQRAHATRMPLQQTQTAPPANCCDGY